MCVRMPLSSWSIAGVPSSRALPGYPITAHHLCAFPGPDVLGGLAVCHGHKKIRGCASCRVLETSTILKGHFQWGRLSRQELCGHLIQFVTAHYSYESRVSTFGLACGGVWVIINKNEKNSELGVHHPLRPNADWRRKRQTHDIRHKCDY